MKHILTLILLSLVTFLTVLGQSQIKVIKAGRVIDTESGTVLDSRMILIENDTIRAIGKDLKVPANAEVIDLSNATVLPGLIDCHTHITGQMESGDYVSRFKKSAMDAAILAPTYSKNTLEAGFTSVRDMASSDFLDVAMKRAIDAHKLPGPRIQPAVFYIGSTGSHGDMNGLSPWLDFKTPDEMSGVADGVEGVRKKVRYLVKYGAEVIKFGASAGVLSEEEGVAGPQYTQEEMNAIVDEAKMWGRKAAAHAHGTEAIKMAVKAGVASIEHGSLIDDEGIALMKQRGTYLVADIYNDDFILAEFTKQGFPKYIVEKERMVGLKQRQNFQKAVKAGVKVAFGTDAGIFPHGWNAKQFAHMVKWGMTPMQAIQAATIHAADLLGWKEKVGSIKEGKLADIIAVSGNPVDNVAVLENVSFVMKGGEVFKNQLKK